jgi:hypothetical protein
MTARLRLVLVLGIAKWSKNLFVILVLLDLFVLLLMITNRLVDFSQKRGTF